MSKNVQKSENLKKINKKIKSYIFKSCILETKHLSTDADISTDITVGWTKNTQKPNIFEKLKKSSRTKNSKTSRIMQKLAISPSTRGL